jgi:hypothetical protein
LVGALVTSRRMDPLLMQRAGTREYITASETPHRYLGRLTGVCRQRTVKVGFQYDNRTMDPATDNSIRRPSYRAGPKAPVSPCWYGSSLSRPNS